MQGTSRGFFWHALEGLPGLLLPQEQNQLLPLTSPWQLPMSKRWTLLRGKKVSPLSHPR